MLEIADLRVDYDGFQILWGVDLHVAPGEIVCILGPNGAGKSTLMNSISGLVRPRFGTISFKGERIDGLPSHQIVGRGLAHVLERHRVFPYLTVEQNLILGSYLPRARAERAQSLEWVHRLFPRLKERSRQLAHTMSGGEQQQLAIARGLMSRPSLLMLDEPFLGLSPAVVEDIVDIVRRVRDEGVTVLFIEQNVELALGISDRGYILESGRVAVTGTGRELLTHPKVLEVYLGVTTA